MVENTEINTQTVPVTETQTVAVNSTHNKKGISLGSVVIAFTLLGLLALAGVGYFLWDQLRSEQQGLGGNLDKGDKRIIELRKQINTTQSQLTTTEKQLTNLTETQTNSDKQYERLLKEQSKLYEDRLKNTNAQLDLKMNNIQRQLGQTRGDWLVADAEYLLSIANERLHLTQDIKTTIMALEAADHRLRESGDGGVFKVREEIAGEISLLKNVSIPDFVGMLNKISILQKNSHAYMLSLPTVNSTPRAITNTPAPGNEDDNDTFVDKAVDRALTDLKELVIVRKRDPNTITILQPEEARIIREDLLIRLDMAKSALARRDEKEFNASLASAKAWLIEHFDTRAKDVKAGQSLIEKLMKTQLNSQLPDISKSLKMLRDVTKFRIKADQKEKGSNSSTSITDTTKSKAVPKRPQKTGEEQPEKTGVAK